MGKFFKRVILFAFLAIIGFSWLSGCAKEKCSDDDGDGYGDYCSLGLDCDDDDPTIYYGAPEICDGKDNQCPGDDGYGKIDEGCVASVSAGDYHTCAIGAYSGLKCFGSNENGQLGIGETVEMKEIPTPVKDILEVIQVATGWYHTCALVFNGNVWCWGEGVYGQMGNGSTDVNNYSPLLVPTLSNIKAISARGMHTCALTNTGGVKCWGWNEYGQVGNGTYDSPITEPVDVVGLDAGVKAIAVGGEHSCALLDSGTVNCWGLNSNGQLGNDSTAWSNEPVEVIGISNVSQIALGDEHSCALLSDGIVKCWGWNGYGQLGDGTYEDRWVPTPVLGAPVSGIWLKAKAIALGDDHSCALISDGTVKCWGYNYYGGLGDGTLENRNIPVEVLNLSGVKALTAGQYHTCGLLSSGVIKCWGGNEYGQLGDGTTQNKLKPLTGVSFGD